MAHSTGATGVTASMLGTTTRTDGTVQVTYNGWPLYTYSKDMVPGDMNGEGFASLWYMMTPAGTEEIGLEKFDDSRLLPNLERLSFTGISCTIFSRRSAPAGDFLR